MTRTRKSAQGKAKQGAAASKRTKGAPKDLGNRGKTKGAAKGRAGKTKTSAVHAQGGDSKSNTAKRAATHKARLKRANTKASKASPRGVTKAVKNIARGKLAGKAGLAGLAAAVVGEMVKADNAKAKKTPGRPKTRGQMARGRKRK